MTDRRILSPNPGGKLGRKMGAAAMVSLCASMAGASGLNCEHAEEAEPAAAATLCQALADALHDRALPSDGLTLEVTAAEAGLVAARLRWQGEAGPLVQVIAMDGPLLPDWPARLAADLLQTRPPQ